MEPITLGQLLQAVNGRFLGQEFDLNTEILRVDTDSRAIHPSSLFIPLVGERFDGHAYIAAALDGGAAGCLTARERECYRPDKFYIKVANTQRALRDLAAWVRRRFDIPVIAITGSVGKTTCKDMIAAVLGTKYKVLKTEGNFNNNIGLPLTLLRLNREYQVCVLEMGMDRFGEIDYLAELARPDVGIVTNVGDAHIERLGSRENILKAKCELIPHIKPGGLLLLNGDDPLLFGLRGNTPLKTIFYGKDEHLSYRAQDIGGDGVSNTACRLITPKMDQEVAIPALGKHMVYPALAAAAVGEHFGLTSDQIRLGLTCFVPTRMRMNILRRDQGITILDDTYNANPQSMRAAISVLADSRSPWKVAVLGDMFELGPYAPALHVGVGSYLGKCGIDCLVAIGELGEQIAQGAKDSGVPEVYHCADKEQAIPVLKELVRPESTILLKASRGMKLEQLTAALLELTQPEPG